MFLSKKYCSTLGSYVTIALNKSPVELRESIKKRARFFDRHRKEAQVFLAPSDEPHIGKSGLRFIQQDRRSSVRQQIGTNVCFSSTVIAAFCNCESQGWLNGSIQAHQVSASRTANL